MDRIRKASSADVSRIAEIIISNYRMNFFPIFGHEAFYFQELNVVDMASSYLDDETALHSVYVYDDGVVKGIVQIKDHEIEKLFVEPQFQSMGIGAQLLSFAVSQMEANRLWVLEYNKRGIAFYKRHGFRMTGDRIIEDEYVPLLKMSLDSSMEIRKITKDSADKPVLDEINREAFPENQRTELDDLFDSDDGHLDVLCISCEGKAVGFFTVRQYRSIAYVGYFAIAKGSRSHGYGSRALNLLKDYYCDKQLVIEIESVLEDCDDLETRQKRKKFYIDNGMIPTGWYLYYDEVELEVICSEKDFHKQEFQELSDHIHTLYYDFVPEFYRKEGR